MLLGEAMRGDAAALSAAETWVHDPTEQNRQAALNIGSKAASTEAPTWLALAAGWTSGTFPSTPFAVPPYMTARAVRIALLICVDDVDPDERPRLLQSCLAQGIELAETGP
jgi:hypothetical protein